MALLTSITTAAGYVATYHKITQLSLHIEADAATCIVTSWKDAAAKVSGSEPAALQKILLASSAAAIGSDPSGSIAAAYTSLKLTAAFTDASDV